MRRFGVRAPAWRSGIDGPPLGAALAVLTIAAALRLRGLDAQSLWYDEGISLALAPRGVGDILAGAAADIHPPLYYLLLHNWVALAGTTEFAARFVSAAAGLLAVAAAIRLGAHLGGTALGLAGGVLAATSPLLVYYSLEARMYALAAALATLGLLALALALRRVERDGAIPGRRFWGGVALLAAALLYTHYVAVAALLGQALALLLWLGLTPTPRRVKLGLAARWLAAQAIAALVFAPWLAATWRSILAWPSSGEAVAATALARRVAATLAFGLPGAEAVGGAALVAAALALAGTAAAAWGLVRPGPRRAGGAALVWLAAATPPLALYVLSLRRPLYNPKFLLIAVPAFDLVLAVGALAIAAGAGAVLAGRMGRRAAKWTTSGLTAALVAVVAAAQLAALQAQSSDPRYARDDYRGLAADVAAALRPGDAVVLNAPGQLEVFDYYFRAEAARYPLPRARPPDPAATAAELASVAATHGRVWAVLWATAESDPAGLVESWLDERLFKASHRWYGGVRLALYVNPAAGATVDEGFEGAQRFDVRATFGGAIELLGAEALATRARPGEVVPLTLRWRALRPIADRYTVFVHAIDPADYLWGQRDGEPAGGARPTSSWSIGDAVEDRHGLPILPGTPPGEYQIEIGLYDGRTGVRLPVVVGGGEPLGDRLLFGPLRVLRAGAGAPSPSPRRRVEASWPAARLVGYDLARLGHDPDDAPLAPADVALVTLYWEGTGRGGDERVALRLRDGAGTIAREHVGAPAAGRYPFALWELGEPVRDPRKVPLGGLPSGRYQIEVALRDGAGRPVPAASGEIATPIGALEIR